METEPRSATSLVGAKQKLANARRIAQGESPLHGAARSRPRSPAWPLWLCLLLVAGYFFYTHARPLPPVDPLAPGAQKNMVYMYSLSYCPACKAMARRLAGAQVRYVEYMLDHDAGRRDELGRLLDSAGVGGGSIGVPVLVVDGRLFLGVRDLRDILPAVLGET